jgi:hypothetical protein
MQSEGDASAERLLAEPFTFTQDELLSPGEFCKPAETRGIDVSLDQLRDWHATGWLRPLLLIVETDDATTRVSVPSHRLASRNFVGDTILAAGDGRLFDGEGFLPDVAPYVPDRKAPLRSPSLFSSWQLLDLRSLPVTADAPGDVAGAATARRRARTLLLCHGAVWASPRIMDSLRLPDGQETVPLWQEFANAADPVPWLTAVGWTPADLVKDAERLLLQAHHDDPNEEWLPIVRHMAPASWRRLRGLARDAIERRIAAEVLLAIHDRLVQRGDAQPLPDLAAATGWHPLHDRLLGPELDRVPIEQALSRYGLSPHPRAVLLVEGESEAIAARLLLEELATSSADCRSPARRASGGDPLVPLPGVLSCPPVDPAHLSQRNGPRDRDRHAAPRGGGPPTPGPPTVAAACRPSGPGRLGATPSLPASRKPLRPTGNPGAGTGPSSPSAGRTRTAGPVDRPSRRELPRASSDWRGRTQTGATSGSTASSPPWAL